MKQAVRTRINEDSLRGLLPHIIRVASEAGKAIWEIYQRNFNVSHKSDFSPVTEADLKANELIIDSLAELNPRWPVVSEEETIPDFSQRAKWDYHWLVDPLDGTREFIKGNDEFTVNIALIHRHQPVLGVIHVPATGETYFANAGGGAFKLFSDGRVESIRARAWDGRHIIVASSRGQRTELFKRFLAGFVSCDVLPLGSSLKSCMIAEGRADVYARFGPTAEWDTAAAQCIVEEAGGRMCDLQLRALSYNQRHSLINPSFIVIGDVNHKWATYLPRGTD